MHPERASRIIRVMAAGEQRERAIVERLHTKARPIDAERTIAGERLR